MKKYEFTNNTIVKDGRILHEIIALKDFGNIKAGDLGGYIEKEENLSHYENCWVAQDAQVFDDAVVCNDALVTNYAKVFENAKVSGNAIVSDNALVCEYARVRGNAEVYGCSYVSGKAEVFGNAKIYNYAEVTANTVICDNAHVYGHSKVSGNAHLYGEADISKLGDYISTDGVNDDNSNLTFFRQKDGSILVYSNYSDYTLEEFRKKVKEIHGDSETAKKYLMIADLMEMHFSK